MMANPTGPSLKRSFSRNTPFQIRHFPVPLLEEKTEKLENGVVHYPADLAPKNFQNRLLNSKIVSVGRLSLSEERELKEVFLNSNNKKKRREAAITLSLNFLHKLVEVNTTQRNSEFEKCASLICEEMRSLGIEPEVYYGEKEKPNVVGRINKNSKSTVILNAHYDTVNPDGWKTNPFEMQFENGVMKGLGVADNKGAIALALYSAFEGKKNVILAFTCDEEIGGKAGLGYLVEKDLIDGDYAIILDGPNILTVAGSGIIQGIITIRGKGGHASIPFKHKNNAVNLLGKVERIIREFEKVQSRKVSRFYGFGSKKALYNRIAITHISTGNENELNTLPSIAKVGFDMRVIPELSIEKAERELLNFLNSKFKEKKINAEVEIIKKREPYYSEGTIVEELKRIAKIKKDYGSWGACDANYLAKKMPVVCFGFAHEKNNIHSSEEHLSLNEFKKVREKLIKLIS